MGTPRAAALVALAAASAQDETTMTMEEVPAGVMKAATAANTMGTEFTSVATDDDVREFANTGADGMGFEVDAVADGTLEEVERQVAPEALPAEVEESTRADGAVVHEFEGTHEGMAVDAEIAADGTGFGMNGDAAG